MIEAMVVAATIGLTGCLSIEFLLSQAKMCCWIMNVGTLNRDLRRFVQFFEQDVSGASAIYVLPNVEAVTSGPLSGTSAGKCVVILLNGTPSDGNGCLYHRSADGQERKTRIVYPLYRSECTFEADGHVTAGSHPTLVASDCLGLMEEGNLFASIPRPNVVGTRAGLAVNLQLQGYNFTTKSLKTTCRLARHTRNPDCS
jgi:hypothetical protein